MKTSSDRGKTDQDPSFREGTVLDRIQMPPMSGDEALRRFHKTRAEHSENGENARESELSTLHPLWRGIAVGGTLLLLVAAVLSVLYLIALMQG